MSLKFGNKFDTAPMKSMFVPVPGRPNHASLSTEYDLHCHLCGCIFMVDSRIDNTANHTFWSGNPDDDGNADGTSLLGIYCSECALELWAERDRLERLLGLTDYAVDNELVWKNVRTRRKSNG